MPVDVADGVLAKITGGNHQESISITVQGLEKNEEDQLFGTASDGFTKMPCIFSTEHSKLYDDRSLVSNDLIQVSSYTTTNVNGTSYLVILELDALATCHDLTLSGDESPSAAKKQKLGSPSEATTFSNQNDPFTVEVELTAQEEDRLPMIQSPDLNITTTATQTSPVPSSDHSSIASDTGKRSYQPISTLTPGNETWTIRATVNKIQPLHTASIKEESPSLNQRQESPSLKQEPATAFTCILVDEQGTEIESTFWPEQAAAFGPALKEGGTYFISNGTIVTNDWKLPTVNNDYSITMNELSTIEPACDESMPHSSELTTEMRPYQRRICAEITSKNAMVVLPTGSGKTLIAARTIFSVYSRAQHTAAKGRSLFLVPTVNLVEQQAKSIAYETRLTVNVLQGNTQTPVTASAVLVSTPVRFIQAMHENAEMFGLDKFGLIVFDEVHHVSKNHPYRTIAKLLEMIPSEGRPQVCGLTASLTYAVSHKRMESDIHVLVSDLGINVIETADEIELRAGGYTALHGTDARTQAASSTDAETVLPFIDKYRYKSPTGRVFEAHEGREEFMDAVRTRTGPAVCLALMDITSKVEKIMSSELTTFRSPMYVKGKSGQVKAWGTYAKKLAGRHEKSGRSNDRAITEACRMLEHLYEAARIMIVYRLADTDLALAYLDMSLGRGLNGCPCTDDPARAPSIPEAIYTELAKLLEAGHDNLPRSKFWRLKSMLLNLTDRLGPKFHGIVFVQQRISTHILKYLIERDEDLHLLFAQGVGCLYATSTPASSSFSMTRTDERNTLDKFSSQQLNLVVATAVAEEGMDIQAANSVIRFDPIQTPVSLVQSRGRARQEDSSFLVLEEMSGKRSLASLQGSERHQANLVESNKFGLDVEDGNLKLEREAAQAARDKSAMIWLQKNAKKSSSVPVQVLETYATKVRGKVLWAFKADNTDRTKWAVTGTLLTPGVKVTETCERATAKTAAKWQCATDLLAALKKR